MVFRLGHECLKYLLESKFIDLAYHYFYATMIRLRLSPFSTEAVEQVNAILNIRRAGGGPVYPPLYWILFQPLTLLPFRIVAILWLSLSVTMSCGSQWLVLRNTVGRPSLTTLVLLLSILVLYQPLYEDLVLGQNNAILLLLATGTWLAISKRRLKTAGLMLGLMSIIKPHYLFIIAFLVLLGWWRVAVIGAATWIGGILGAIPYLGWGYFQLYGQAMWHHYNEVAASYLNLSLAAQLSNVFGTALWLRLSLYIFAVVILIVCCVRYCRRYRACVYSSDQVLIAFTILMVITPHLEEHHLLLLLLPISYLALRMMTNGGEWRGLIGTCYVAAFVLLASRYSINRYIEDGYEHVRLLLALKSVGAAMLLMALCGWFKQQSANSVQAPVVVGSIRDAL
jgi:hypothetical protein